MSDAAAALTTDSVLDSNRSSLDYGQHNVDDDDDQAAVVAVSRLMVRRRQHAQTTNRDVQPHQLRFATPSTLQAVNC